MYIGPHALGYWRVGGGAIVQLVDPKLSTLNPVFETWDPKPETRNPKTENRKPEP
jgi:hypothetical protein